MLYVCVCVFSKRLFYSILWDEQQIFVLILVQLLTHTFIDAHAQIVVVRADKWCGILVEQRLQIAKFQVFTLNADPFFSSWMNKLGSFMFNELLEKPHSA